MRSAASRIPLDHPSPRTAVQVFPPLLSTLTYLELESDHAIRLGESQAHTVLRALRHLDLHTHICPPGLRGLDELTYLRSWGQAGEGGAFNAMEFIAEVTQLRHLVLTGGDVPEVRRCRQPPTAV
jgi:hypothetical protein